MTGVDVEHTKAHEKPCDHCALIWQGWARAVERVQALRTPAVDSELKSTYCLGCDATWPCDTRKALEMP